MVNIKEGSLCAFEQYVFACFKNFAKHNAGVANMRAEFFGISQVFFQHAVIVKRFAAVNFGNNFIFGSQVYTQLVSKSIGFHQIADADAGTGYFIHVAGADAAFGSADFVFAERSFLQFVQFCMVRHNNVGAVGNQKIAAVNALGFHACNFLKYNCGVNNYAVAEDIDFIFVQYAGGQKTQFVGNVVYNNGVPAGITYNSVGFLSQVINNLAFAFIAPLGADNYNR